MGECILLGVDGGGSRTRAALVSAEGQVLGLGESGPGNLRDVGAVLLERHLAEALDGACAAAGLPRAPSSAAHLGLAGVATETERSIVREIGLRLELAPAALLAVDSDLPIALEGGLSTRPGMVVIAGTGSVCFGRRADGETARAGGHGAELDDVGSAHDLGRRALIAALRAADRRGPPTRLSADVLDDLGVETLHEVLGQIARDLLPRPRVASLARTVTTAASRGDPVANSILQDGAAELAHCAASVWTRLREPSADGASDEIALVGGLALSSTYRPVLIDALREVLPAGRVIPAELPPVLGAALQAMQRVGIERTVAVLDRLQEQGADSAPR